MLDPKFSDKVFFYAILAWMWRPTRYLILAAVIVPWTLGIGWLFGWL